MGSKIYLKIHFLVSDLNLFANNFGAVSEKQVENCDQDISIKEKGNKMQE